MTGEDTTLHNPWGRLRYLDSGGTWEEVVGVVSGDDDDNYNDYEEEEVLEETQQDEYG